MRRKIRECFLLLATTVAAFLGGGIASAIEAPATILSNPNSPSSITVTREVTNVVNPVTNTFSYSFEAVDDENPALVGNIPSGLSIVFDGTSPVEGVATEMATLDLGAMSFTEVGDYKFILRERTSGNETAYPVDTSKQYYVTVSVRNEIENGTPTGRLIPTLALQVLNFDQGSKMDAVFSSNAVLTYVQISKKVEGNLARRDEYFKFYVEFTGATDGDEFSIVGQDPVVTYHGETINTQDKIILGQENYVYLKHDQVVMIGTNGEQSLEIPAGIDFYVEEEQSNDYVAWVDGMQTNNNGWSTLWAADFNPAGMLNGENQASFVNVKEASVLTGIVMNVLPFVLIVMAGAIGVFVVRKTVLENKHEN